MKKFLTTLTVNAVILWFSIWVFNQDYLDTLGSTFFSRVMFFLGVGLMLALVNFLVKPILSFLSFPLLLISFGLFSLVINAFVVLLTWRLATDFNIGFGEAFFTGLMLSLANTLLIGDYDKKRRS